MSNKYEIKLERQNVTFRHFLLLSINFPLNGKKDSTKLEIFNS